MKTRYHIKVSEGVFKKHSMDVDDAAYVEYLCYDLMRHEPKWTVVFPHLDVAKEARELGTIIANLKGFLHRQPNKNFAIDELPDIVQFRSI